MQQSDIPAKFPLFWGANAGGGFIRNIPVASQIGITSGAASLADGFPPLNFQPVGSGGVPPFGADMNGIMRQMTQWLQWAEAGGPIAYDASFQSEIGGYPKGAVVASAVTLGLSWLSTVDNNVTNPDTGGAGWRRYFTSGGLIATRAFPNSTIYTPTPGTNSIRVLVVGSGGGGGGSPAMSAAQFAAAGGGASGGWSKSFLTAGFAGLAITIGAGGPGGVGANGQSGGLTSFGSLISITGGSGGADGNPSTNPSTQVGGGGGVATGGNLFNSSGNPGQSAISLASVNMVSGGGGASILGGGGRPVASTTANGNPGGGPGAGGSGSAGANSGAQTTGGAGANGLVIVEEFA